MFDSDLLFRAGIRFLHKGIFTSGNSLVQSTADAVAGRVRVGKDDHAAVFGRFPDHRNRFFRKAGAAGLNRVTVIIPFQIRTVMTAFDHDQFPDCRLHSLPSRKRVQLRSMTSAIYSSLTPRTSAILFTI